MRYWWASQGKNFQHVAQHGNLWTCPPPTGGRARPDRELIKKLAPGDLVFHYGGRHLRAISEVTADWTPHPRPEHYERQRGESNNGWLVATTPIIRELEVHFEILAELVTHGSPGPLDRNGRPAQKFLSTLGPEDAHALLQMVDPRVEERHTRSEEKDEACGPVRPPPSCASHWLAENSQHSVTICSRTGAWRRVTCVVDSSPPNCSSPHTSCPDLRWTKTSGA